MARRVLVSTVFGHMGGGLRNPRPGAENVEPVIVTLVGFPALSERTKKGVRQNITSQGWSLGKGLDFKKAWKTKNLLFTSLRNIHASARNKYQT